MSEGGPSWTGFIFHRKKILPLSLALIVVFWLVVGASFHGKVPSVPKLRPPFRDGKGDHVSTHDGHDASNSNTEDYQSVNGGLKLSDPLLAPELGGPLDPYASKVFMMLKTGSRVLRERFPVHLTTTLPRWPVHAVYAGIGDNINGVEIIDTFHDLPKDILNSPALTEYRIFNALRTEKWEWDSDAVGGDSGWDSDKYKNVPMLAHAYQHAPKGIDWYVFIDDDTFVFQRGLLEFLKALDPDEVIYTGNSVPTGFNSPTHWVSLRFAHGGSGVVLSRGAMQAMFGPDPQNNTRIEETKLMAAIDADTDCCGDAVVAKTLYHTSGHTFTDYFNSTDGNTHKTPFHGGSIQDLRFFEDTWCMPLYTWHHISSREVETLFNFEQSLPVNHTITYEDVYHHFYLPHLVEERPCWNAMAESWRIDATSMVDDTRTEVFHNNHLWPNATQEDCKKGCGLVPDCMVWTYEEGICRYEQGAVVRGHSHNPFIKSVSETPMSSGWMLERIRLQRAAAICDPLQYNPETGYNDTPETSEGWRVRQLLENGHDLQSIRDM